MDPVHDLGREHVLDADTLMAVLADKVAAVDEGVVVADNAAVVDTVVVGSAAVADTVAADIAPVVVDCIAVAGTVAAVDNAAAVVVDIDLFDHSYHSLAVVVDDFLNGVVFHVAVVLDAENDQVQTHHGALPDSAEDLHQA